MRAGAKPENQNPHGAGPTSVPQTSSSPDTTASDVFSSFYASRPHVKGRPKMQLPIRRVERTETPIMFVAAKDGSDEIGPAWDHLETVLGSLRGRRFFGVFDDSGIYRCCVQVRAGDDADQRWRSLAGTCCLTAARHFAYKRNMPLARHPGCLEMAHKGPSRACLGLLRLSSVRAVRQCPAVSLTSSTVTRLGCSCR